MPSNLVVKAGSAGLYGPDHVNGGNLLLSAGTPRGTGTMGRVVAQGVFDATNLTASTNLVVTTTRSADIRIGPEYGIGKSAGTPGKNLYLFASDAGPAATAGSVVITAGSGGEYGTNGAIELVGGVSMTGDVNMQSNRVLNAETSNLSRSVHASVRHRMAIDQLAAEGRTVMIATHEVEQAAAWDLVLCLNESQIAFGEPDSVLTKPVLEATYGGHIVELPGQPELTVLPSHHHDHEGQH